MYPQFCAFAHAVDDKLGELGAKQVASMGEGDELNGQEESFNVWACTVFKVHWSPLVKKNHILWQLLVVYKHGLHL